MDDIDNLRSNLKAYHMKVEGFTKLLEDNRARRKELEALQIKFKSIELVPQISQILTAREWELLWQGLGSMTFYLSNQLPNLHEELASAKANIDWYEKLKAANLSNIRELPPD